MVTHTLTDINPNNYKKIDVVTPWTKTRMRRTCVPKELIGQHMKISEEKVSALLSLPAAKLCQSGYLWDVKMLKGVLEYQKQEKTMHKEKYETVNEDDFVDSEDECENEDNCEQTDEELDTEEPDTTAVKQFVTQKRAADILGLAVHTVRTYTKNPAYASAVHGTKIDTNEMNKIRLSLKRNKRETTKKAKTLKPASAPRSTAAEITAEDVEQYFVNSAPLVSKPIPAKISNGKQFWTKERLMKLIVLAKNECNTEELLCLIEEAITFTP